ncbi:MAG: hypothetical protein IPI43_29130 [Sandaracinaceae bacterium]|nr:hypothetical protein [Sandaracinaceae bacterium]
MRTTSPQSITVCAISSHRQDVGEGVEEPEGGLQALHVAEAVGPGHRAREAAHHLGEVALLIHRVVAAAVARRVDGDGGVARAGGRLHHHGHLHA